MITPASQYVKGAVPTSHTMLSHAAVRRHQRQPHHCDCQSSPLSTPTFPTLLTHVFNDISSYIVSSQPCQVPLLARGADFYVA
jgi:hypothetical protein